VRFNNNPLYNIRLTESNDISGVSAGDAMSSKYGAWAAPFYSQSTQKTTGKDSGNDTKAAGGTIGIDGKINEDLTVGIAETFVDTRIKYKPGIDRSKKGNKSKISSFITSIYASQNLSRDWFVQGIASFGYNNVRNTKMRDIGNLEAISAKYTSRTYGVEVVGGYSYQLDDTTSMIPTAGLRYDRFFSNKYREQGDILPLTTSTTNIDRLDGILGMKVAKMVSMEDGMILIPEVHGNFNYHILNKAPSYSIQLDGVAEPFVQLSSAPEKTLYNLGTSLSANYNMMEYSLGYDATITNKYLGHQGTMKITVNF
jgi:outer membrane autotransporter protein